MSLQSTVTVGTTPTPLFTPTSGLWGYLLSVAIDGEDSPGGVIYVGSDDVTATGEKKGRRLADGDVLDIGISSGQGRRGSVWHAVAATGTVKVSVLVIPGD